ncbi:TusE/DsrC/DsvC family sulfur relay protein [Dasania sp. GY-MA-18]|uniref:Sulfurtransferase n=1 Tax=Dasania phycosphaerae TaxID=2950436 RepID=A0A9J6RRZ9_9GAMM|nr:MULTISPECIES: TusE/DsrC/DsvC family sulfur relay protein [Dasania]MCR8924291.1 TusE/DsrC/DsvC family sulfur relay protein [Dasania sp. GY-MA-18]MCZ0866944.1 TusE/DsrC/DsvC family sulfur relay protein [Dasania phycosphaerae]MCZ0870448.1 TusE/DsrC/DsvC family sulfur relay protein [Dasania phycosphaerae]
MAAVDKEGFLVDLHDWNEGVASELAAAEGITLSEEHWQVIQLLRQFYQEFQLSPAMRPLVKYVGLHLGADKGKSMYLLKLFPGSPAKLASKIAGLPKPDNCL